MMNGRDMSGQDWAWMTLMMGVGALLFVLLVVVVVIAVVRGLSRPSHERSDEALAVLRRRFAAGEIDEAEYQRRHDALRASDSRFH